MSESAVQSLHTRSIVLTLLVGCGPSAGPKSTPVEQPPPVIVQAVPDAAPPPDAPDVKRLVCDNGLVVVPAPSPDPTWYCARPDGTRQQRVAVVVTRAHLQALCRHALTLERMLQVAQRIVAHLAGLLAQARPRSGA